MVVSRVQMPPRALPLIGHGEDDESGQPVMTPWCLPPCGVDKQVGGPTDTSLFESYPDSAEEPAVPVYAGKDPFTEF
jgi:hypothetical protein